MSQMLSLARLYLISPRRSAAAAKQDANLKPSLGIYTLFLATFLIFFWLKPADFPDANASMPFEDQGLGFWLKVMLWQLPLEAGWIVFLLGLARYFQTGSWPVRFAAALAWTALPFILFVSYGQSHWPRVLLQLALLLWAGPFYFLIRNAPAQEYKPLAIYMLGLNAIGIVLVAPMAVATLMKASGLFTFIQAAGGLWMLAFASLGLRELTGLRLPRAFMAVLFSMFLQIALAFHLHLGGLVPKEILKALFYA